jgi:hypothetical protein
VGHVLGNILPRYIKTFFGQNRFETGALQGINTNGLEGINGKLGLGLSAVEKAYQSCLRIGILYIQWAMNKVDPIVQTKNILI